ncbi:MAG: PhoU domain-containing protein, partial [Planctomycetota bacterium]
ALHFFTAARHVERIADHATNIAEDVIYLVEGEITRHSHEAPARYHPTPEDA